MSIEFKAYSKLVIIFLNDELNGWKNNKYHICKLRWEFQNLMAKLFSLNDISGMPSIEQGTSQTRPSYCKKERFRITDKLLPFE